MTINIFNYKKDNEELEVDLIDMENSLSRIFND